MRKLSFKMLGLILLSGPLTAPAVASAQVVVGRSGDFKAMSISDGIAPMISMPSADSSKLIQKYLTGNSLIRVGSFVMETAELRNFYSQRNFTPIWVDAGQLTSIATGLKAQLNQVESHGLNPLEYWSPLVEAAVLNLSKNPSEITDLTAELLMTDAYLKAAQHIANGRYEPDQIDNDIKFKKKNLGSVETISLMTALSASPDQLFQTLDALAPQHQHYRQLLTVLSDLKKIKASNQSYLKMAYPNINLKPGSKTKTAVKLRQALRDRGFEIATEGDLYDTELEKAVMLYQSEQNLDIDAEIDAKSEFWRSLSFSIDQRIKQTEISLEKFRWTPKVLESRYILVNTAFTEFHLFEGQDAVLEMRTINGRPLWRTPSMRDLIAGVILNPTWTATDSIVTQIKLPEIIKDVGYLAKLRIRVRDRVTGEEIDPTTINWAQEGRNIVKKVIFVQDPGPNNALGVVKFPLVMNRDDIYMHDTDERSFFPKAMRLRSSGCIRLEKPLELASYLLQKTEYTPERIDQLIAKGTPDEVYQTNQRVNLPRDQWLPVYTLYATVERAKSGRIRFATDWYGQDQRVAAAVLQTTSKRDGP